MSYHLPGPVNLPFLGCAYKFLGKDAPEIARVFIELFEEYPDLGKFWLGEDLFYIISKPKYLEIVLNHPGILEKLDLYRYTKPIIGDGLISGPGKKN